MKTVDALTSLLACAIESIETPVCRSFINPGARAPHDVCSATRDGNGQLWVAHITGSAGWPSQTGLPITCAVPFAETIELGIVRCAQSTLKDNELIPKAELVTADAIQQGADRVALKNAMLCCWSLEGRDMLAPIWEPIEPFGGCVGGTWTIVIRDDSCAC